MSPLPKWVEDHREEWGMSHERKLIEALSIAYEALDDITCNYDEAKDDCGICNKGIFGGHTKYCIVPSVQKAMRRITDLGAGK